MRLVDSRRDGPVTDARIALLRAEAAAAGDLAMVMICDRALDEYEPLEHASAGERRLARRFRTPAAARAECVRLILAGDAEGDE